MDNPGMGDGTIEDPVEQAIRQLQREYIEQIPEKIEHMEALAGSLREDPPDYFDRLWEITRMVHSINGTAATFGLGELSRLAQDLELILEAWYQERRPLDDNDFLLIADHLHALGSAAGG